MIRGLSLSAILSGISLKTVVRMLTIEIDLTVVGWRRMFFMALVYFARRGSMKEPGDAKSMVPPTFKS